MSRLAWVGVMLAAFAVPDGAEDRVWPRLPPYPLGPVVVLADGGIVAGVLEAVTDDRLTVESSVLGRLDLPRSIVRGVRASMALGPAPPRLPDPAVGEVAVVRLLNGDVVTATTIAVRGGKVLIRTSLRPAEDVVIPVDVVRAIDFAIPMVAASPPRRFVALADGSRFVAASLPTAIDPADIVATCVEDDGLRLLEALEPVPDERGDADEGRGPLARGRTLTGAWPAARGTTAFTGLGLHAPARVRYRFDRPVRRFGALVAIDDSAGPEGSAIAQVLAIDAAGQAHERYATPILRGGDEPHVVDVDLEDAVGIELVVDPVDGDAAMDRTLWLDPRVEFGSPAE